jgi:hypothetical protein
LGQTEVCQEDGSNYRGQKKRRNHCRRTEEAFPINESAMGGGKTESCWKKIALIQSHKFYRKAVICIAMFFSRSHDAVIRVYDDAGNVIETHEHKGDFKEW